MSFTVWQSKDTIFIIDGHHRFKVLDLLENEGYEVPKKLPCTFIDCKNKKEASKLVLTYSSIYAKVQEEGLYEFLNVNDFNFEEIKSQIDIPEIDFENFTKGFLTDENLENNGINSLNEAFEVVISCKDESEQEQIFNKLKAQYNCRLLTL